MPIVIIVLPFLTGYLHFESGVIRVIEDVLLDPDGLPYVLALVVPLLMFLAGYVEGIIQKSFYLKHFFIRALLHG